MAASTVNTVLAQGKKPAQEVAPTSPPPAPQPPPAPAPAAPQPTYSGAPSVQYVPTYQPAPPTYVPASTVYVTPYPSATYAYYDYAPYYYGGYWGYPSPSWSFSLGIGGFRGGFRGGGFHGGGFHGGGFRGGHR